MNVKRLMIVAFGTFALFSALVFQFYRVQVIQNEKWTRLAHRQHEGVVKESFRRGTFWSNAGLKVGHPERPQALALDVPKFHLHVDPSAISEEARELVAENLRLLAQVDAEEALLKKSRNRQLKMFLSRQEVDRIREWWNPFARAHKLPRNALFFVKDYQRSHPFGKLAGQVLHTIRDRKDEVTEQGIPTGGLEAAFHEQLSGKLGRRWIHRSPRHSLGVGTVIEEPEDGEDIYLTIHPIAQAIAEEEIEKGVQRAQAKGGWAIVMDPNTGEVLALAQYPFFHLERYSDYFNDKARISDTVVKAVTYAYEPGSVMKALNLAVGLSAGFDPEKKVAVSNGKFPGRRKPLKDPRPHSFLNADLAIQKSSNIYPARMIEELIEEHGPEWYTEQLRSCFGLGTRTGIELPGETAGLVPKVGGSSWSKSAPWSMAMGYNLMVNSFQMLRAFAVIANGGKLVQPTLLKQEAKEFPQVLDEEVCARVRRAMRFTTQENGSARRAQIPYYTSAGKTGTAEKVIDGEYSKSTHFCTFIGYTPVEDPQFIILIAIDEPHSLYRYGGTAAAPVFRGIGRRLHDYRGTVPAHEKNPFAKEAKELLKIYEEWNVGES